MRVESRTWNGGIPPCGVEGRVARELMVGEREVVNNYGFGRVITVSKVKRMWVGGILHEVSVMGGCRVRKVPAGLRLIFFWKCTG